MHIHILGICGTFMGGIAMIAKQAGFTVTGSDKNVYPPMSDELSNAGIKLHTGFDAEQLAIFYKEHGFAQLKLFLDSLNVFNLQVNEKNQGLISLKNTFEECNETLNVNHNQELMTQVLDCFNTLKDNNQVLLESGFFSSILLKHK